MMAGGTHLKYAIIGVALGCAPVIASAQDSGGLNGSLSFSQGLLWSEPDGTSARTNLSFGLSSETRTQSLEATVSTGLTQGFGSGGDFDITNPRAALSYGVQSRQTELTTSLSYTRSDADDFVEDPDGAPGILILEEGLRETTNGGVNLTFGREAPFGGTLALGYAETSYSDTTSTDLIDSARSSANLSLRFAINRTVTATLGYTFSDTDRETGRDVISNRVTAGANVDITPTWSADLSVGLRNINVIDAGVETSDDGVTYALGVSQDRPTGSIDYQLSSDLSESGRRTTATAGANFDLLRGSVSGRVGLTDGADNTIRPLLSLSYQQDLPRGSYALSLNQSFGNTDDGDETLNSRLRVSWQQDLNRSARFSSSAAYQITDVLGADEDTNLFRFDLGLSQDVTEDWALSANYAFTVEDGDSRSATHQSEIFIGLETSLGWRP